MLLLPVRHRSGRSDRQPDLGHAPELHPGVGHARRPEAGREAAACCPRSDGLLQVLKIIDCISLQVLSAPRLFPNCNFPDFPHCLISAVADVKLAKCFFTK